MNRGSGYYDRLALLDADSTAERVLIEEPMLCFFWSPDGSKIAYITPSEEAEGSVRWAVLDLESDETSYLVDFLPSREMLTMFMFFDQYGQSHSLWSPDGSKILFAGRARATGGAWAVAGWGRVFDIHRGCDREHRTRADRPGVYWGVVCVKDFPYFSLRKICEMFLMD